MRDEIMRSYQDAEEAANGQGIPEFFDLLQQEEIRIATRIGIQRTGYTEEEKTALAQICTAIVDHLTEIQKILAQSALTSIKLAKDLSIEDQEKLLSGFSISSSNIGCTDIIALYDQTHSESVSENFEGMLFSSDCIYYRNKKSVYVQRMHYLNMLKIEKKWTSVILYGRNGDVIKLDRSFPMLYLLEKIISIVNQDL